MTPEIRIAGRPIGTGHRPYVIAEMSANHLGDYARAVTIMERAAAAGVDAVKLQTYRAETMTLDVDGPGFRIEGGLWDGRTLYDLYQEAATPWEWHAPLFAKGRELGVHVFSSPFDADAIDLLRRLDAPAYKIASFELVDHDLIKRAARTGKPVILSTGMSTFTEIGEGLEAARSAGARELALLHCISGYPTPPSEANLGMIDRLGREFGVVVGISDHTPGALIPAIATGLGASIVEKHLTLARADGGPDGAFSLEPAEFAELCAGCRTAWEATRPLGERRAPSEAASLPFRRSLFVVADVAAGERFTSANVRAIRPGHGMSPKYLDEVLDRTARRPIARGTPLAWDMVDEVRAREEQRA